MLAQIAPVQNALLAFDPASQAPGAETVARALNGLQKALWLLAAAVRSDLAEPGTAERRRLRLAVRPLETGYDLSVGGPQLLLALDWAAAPDRLLATLVTAWGLVARGAFDELDALIPDDDLRRRVLAELAKAAPKAAEGCTARFAGVALDAAAVRALEKHLAAGAALRSAVLTVTGELLGVDFDHGTFSMRYAPTRRTLTGRYAPDAEVWLLKHRRKAIQVDGEFALDVQLRPHQCLVALRFRAVDLAPLTIARLPLAAGELALDPPLSLVPRLDPLAGQRFEVRDDALGLYVEASTREVLEVELAAQCVAMWRRYADGGARDADDPVLARQWRRRARAIAPEAYQEA